MTNTVDGTLRGDGASLFIGTHYADEGGTIVATNGGIVAFNMAQDETFSSVTNTRFVADGTGQVQLGGKIVALRGSITGDVVFGYQNVGSATLGYIDLNSEVTWWGQSHIGKWFPGAGNTLELRSPFRFDGSTGTGVVLGGTLRNRENNTFTLVNGYLLPKDDVVLENRGTMDLQGVRIDMNNGGGSIVSNAPGATLLASAGETRFTSDSTAGRAVYNSGTILADGGTVTFNARLIDNGGSIVATNGGIVSLGSSPKTTATNTEFRAFDTGEIRFGGDIVAVEGRLSGDGRFGMGYLPMNSSSSGYIDLVGEVAWIGQNVGTIIDVEAGQTLEFRSDLFFDGSAGHGMQGGGSGTWMIGTGATFRMVNGGPLYLDAGTLENGGTIDGSANTKFYFRGGTFRNDGTYRVSSNSMAWVHTGGSTFENSGTVEIAGGAALTVPATLGASQYFNGNTLSNGTWDVAGTLNLDPADAGINIIGPGAAARLRGSGVFTELEGNLATNRGTFGVHSKRVYNVGIGDLVSPGTLEFGLADSDASEILVKTGITNAVNVTLSGGRVDVVDLGMTVPGTFTILTWSGTRTGELTLDRVPDNDLFYSLEHNAHSIQLEVSATGPGTVLTLR